jgi:hypothetical protein
MTEKKHGRQLEHNKWLAVIMEDVTQMQNYSTPAWRIHVY